jgi:hypothetical protein
MADVGNDIILNLQSECPSQFQPISKLMVISTFTFIEQVFTCIKVTVSQQLQDHAGPELRTLSSFCFNFAYTVQVNSSSRNDTSKLIRRSEGHTCGFASKTSLRTISELRKFNKKIMKL